MATNPSGNVNPLLACDAGPKVLSDPEIASFKGNVLKFLSARRNEKVSLYFRELNDGLWFSVGDTEQFIPASLRKVPLMIAILKQAEKEKDLLDRQVEYDRSSDDTSRQNFKPSQMLVAGNKYKFQGALQLFLFKP